MINNFLKVYPYSRFNDLAFMWVAENIDGSIRTQYDNEEHFQKLNKSMLMRFGLIGLGLSTYYDIPTGIFYRDNKKIDFIFKTKDYEYNLTNQMILYSDCIMYMKHYSDMNTINTQETTYGFSYGYKTQLNINDVHFSFKALMNIDNGKPPYFTNRIVADRDLQGVFIVKINDFSKFEAELNLEKNKSKEIEIEIY